MKSYSLLLVALLLSVILSSCTINHPDVDTGYYPVEILIGWVPGTSDAWTAGRDTIVFTSESKIKRKLLAHELCHIVQWNTVVDFPLRYASQVSRYGYDDAPFEIEAKEAEEDPWFLQWADYLIEQRKGDS